LSYDVFVIVYHHTAGEDAPPRAHPWTTAQSDSSQRYVDFKAEPHLIRTVLEDWNPYNSESFAETFFQLLEWLNGKDSQLESNDCAFRGAHPNTDTQFKFPHRCDGRLMILYRDLYLNTQPDAVDWLFNETKAALYRTDKKFRAGAVGFSFMQTGYLALGDGVKQAAFGFQIGLSLFAYGGDHSSTHASMDRLLSNLRQALEVVNYRIGLGEVKKLLNRPAKG
jgi:hypothetical protein